MFLDLSCTIENVQDATNETIWYSYHRRFKNECEGYSLEIVMEMAEQLTLRGL